VVSLANSSFSAAAPPANPNGKGFRRYGRTTGDIARALAEDLEVAELARTLNFLCGVRPQVDRRESRAPASLSQGLLSGLDVI